VAADLPAFTLFAAQVTAAVDGARMMDQLVRRERLAALGELAAVVAHEVRNPLGVLFNSLVAFRRLVKLDDEPARLVEIMNEETERLNRIVGELLDFAKPSTPQLELTSLAPIVEDAVKSALASATSEAAVVWNATRDALLVLADPLLMHQAIVNLVHNALQAMKGTGTLTVVVDRDGPHAYLEIRDTGPGVDETSREKMFEPFFTTKATGTGLGLAIVRRVVSDHRGSVVVKNSPDGGCCVRIVLPVAN
jgi:signal transduction histidine kinase